MFNFFSNNLVYVDTEQIEITKSLSGERNSNQKIFQVPSHTVGTNNLLIFLNGILQIKDLHYEDYNSNEVNFKNYISNDIDFIAILIKGNSSGSLEWGYF